MNRSTLASWFLSIVRFGNSVWYFDAWSRWVVCPVILVVRYSAALKDMVSSLGGCWTERNGNGGHTYAIMGTGVTPTLLTLALSAD